jgi:ankyrin repeat protein
MQSCASYQQSVVMHLINNQRNSFTEIYRVSFPSYLIDLSKIKNNHDEGMQYMEETVKHISRFILIEAIEEANWEEACSIVYNDGAYTRIIDKNNDIPMHIAVRMGCTPRLVQLMLTAYPESVQRRDHDGFLPLHLAVKHHKGRLWVNMCELTMIIYSAYPRAISEPDGDGNIALHIALRYQGPDEMIRYLIQAYPQGASTKDKLGNVALHLAIQFGASYMIIHELLRYFPVATSTCNERGITPLHRVAFFNSSLEVLQLILQANPAAAYIRDKYDNLPVHFAYLSSGGCPEESKLKAWLTANPAGLSSLNSNGYSPLTIFHVPQDNAVDDFI